MDKRKILFLILILFYIINFFIFVPPFLYGDEAWSVKISSLGLIESIKNSLNDFHPPLYHIILSIFLYIFPDSEFLLKLLSLFFGILTIYIIYFKFNEFMEDEESIYLSIIVMISPFFLYISTLVRMYSLSLLLSTLSIYYFFKLLKGERKYKIHFILSNLLMMLTHHLTIPLFFIETLYFLIKKSFSNFKASFICGIIYLPFSYIFLIQLKRRLSLSRGWGNILPNTFFKDLFSYLFFNSKNVSILIIFIFLFLIVLGLIKLKNEAQKFFALYFLSYLLIFYLMTIKFGSLYFHYISLIIVPSYFLLIQGVLSFKEFKEKILLFIIIFLFLFTPFSFIKAYPEMEKIREEIKNKKVIFLNRYEMYRFTFNLKGDYKFIMDLPLNNFVIDNEEKLKFTINELKKENKPFLFFYSGVGSDLLSIYDPKGKLKKYLDENSNSKIVLGIYSEYPVYIYLLNSME